MTTLKKVCHNCNIVFDIEVTECPECDDVVEEMPVVNFEEILNSSDPMTAALIASERASRLANKAIDAVDEHGPYTVLDDAEVACLSAVLLEVQQDCITERKRWQTLIEVLKSKEAMASLEVMFNSEYDEGNTSAEDDLKAYWLAIDHFASLAGIPGPGDDEDPLNKPLIFGIGLDTEADINEYGRG